MNKRISVRRDVLASRSLMLIALMKAANLTFENTSIIPEAGERLFLGLIIIALVIHVSKYLYHYFSTIRVSTILIFGMLGLSYLVAYIVWPEYQDNIIKRTIWTLLFCSICYFCCNSIRSYKVFFDELYNFSFLVTILGFVFFFYDEGKLSSSITFAAMMLFPFSIQFGKLIENRNPLLLALCAFEFFSVFIHGSRGGLIYLIICIILILYKKRVFETRRGNLVIILSSIIILIVAISLNQIGELLSSNGIYIRNFDKIFHNTFWDDNGRNAIQIEYMTLVFNDLPINLRVVDGFNNGTNYPHNIFVEFLYDYGLVFGGLLIIAIITKVFQRLKSAEGDELNILNALLVSGFLPLLTSFTYFEWPLFWALLGFLLSPTLNVSKTETNDPFKMELNTSTSSISST